MNSPLRHKRSFIHLQASNWLMASACIACIMNANAANETEPKVVSAAAQAFSKTHQTKTLAQLIGTHALSLPNLDYEDSQAGDASQAKGLAEFVALSLQSSPQLRQTLAQFESAQARVGVTRADLLPNASVRLARGPEESATTITALPPTGTNKHTYSSKTYRLTQPVLNLPAFLEFDGSRKSRDASALRLDAMREATALAATKATIELAASRVTINFADKQIEQLNQILTYLEARASAGASSQADLERARTRVLAAKQIRLEQQTNYRNAILELSRLTGSTPQAIQLPSLELLPALPSNQQDIRQLVTEQNFELIALRKEVDAQKKQVSAEYSRSFQCLVNSCF